MKDIIDKLSNTWINTLFILGTIKPKKLKTAMLVLATFIFVVIGLYLFFKFIPDSSIIFTKNFDIGISDFLVDTPDSTFLTTILIAFFGSAFGAGAAAWFAHWLVTKHQQKKELLSELIVKSNAVVTSALELNKVMSFKKQTMPERQKFYTQRENLITQIAAKVQPISVTFMGMIFDSPLLEQSTLEKAINQNGNLHPRLPGALLEIKTAYSDLNSVIEKRNQYIREHQQKKIPPQEEFNEYCRIYGIKNNGSLDKTYVSMMKGIELKIDDLIFYLYLFHEDMCKHVVELNKIYKKLGGKVKITRYRLDLQQAMQDGWLPPIDEYLNWLELFPNTPIPDLYRKTH